MYPISKNGMEFSNAHVFYPNKTSDICIEILTINL